MPAAIETLTLPNFSSINILEEFQLSADAAAGQAIVAFLNAQNANVNDYIVLNPSQETSEYRQVLSLSGQNVTFTANLLLQHRNHERAIRIFGNQIRVYRAANVDGTPPADSVFKANGVLGTVTLDVDQSTSYYTDNVGGSDWWYKFTYYNPTTSLETDISLAEAVRGGGWGHYVSIADVVDEAGLSKLTTLDQGQVAARRAEAESEIKGKLASAGYSLPLQTATGAYFTPPLIENIARLLTAGYLLSKNFGTTKPGSAKDGKSKSDLAMQKLAEIQLNDTILLDSNEQPLTKATLLDGWPDDTTKDDGENVGPRIRMDQKF